MSVPRVCDTFPASWTSSRRSHKAAPAVTVDSEALIGQRGNITHVHAPKMGESIPNWVGREMLPGRAPKTDLLDRSWAPAQRPLQHPERSYPFPP